MLDGWLDRAHRSRTARPRWLPPTAAGPQSARSGL